MESVTIPKSEYLELLHDQKVLYALYAGGVDNWEWYGEALGELEDEEDD